MLRVGVVVSCCVSFVVVYECCVLRGGVLCVQVLCLCNVLVLCVRDVFACD